VKHARDNLQAVLDPVIDLPEQDLMTIKCGLKLALILLLLDRHSENVCSALEKGDVELEELTENMRRALEESQTLLREVVQVLNRR